MALLSRKFIYFLVFITIILLIIKFFTAIVILKDDPSNFLVFYATPSFKNQLLLNSINDNKHIIIMSDENGIVGEGVYYFITKYLWWLLLLFTSFIFYLERKRFKLKTQTDA